MTLAREILHGAAIGVGVARLKAELQQAPACLAPYVAWLFVNFSPKSEES